MPQNVLISLFCLISLASCVISPDQHCPILELDPEKVGGCHSFKIADFRVLLQKSNFFKKKSDPEFELLEMDSFSFPCGACIMQKLIWPDASSHFQWIPVKLVPPHSCECHTCNSSFLAEPVLQGPCAMLMAGLVPERLIYKKISLGTAFWGPHLEAPLLQGLGPEIRVFLFFSKCVVLALLFGRWGSRQWGK